MTDLWCVISFKIILFGLDALALLSAIYFMSRYIKASKTDPDLQQNDTRLHCSTIVFGATVIACFLSGALNIIWDYSCNNPDSQTETSLNAISSVLYLMQAMLMLAFLFYRLCFIFKGTPFALTRASIVAFWGLYIVMLSCGISACIVYTFAFEDKILVGIIFPLSMVLFVALYIILIAMFLQKLMAICRECESKSNNADIVIASTKAFTLTIMSVASTVIFLSIASIYPFLKRDQDAYYNPIIWFIGLCSIVDVYTNFLAVYMGFKLFDRYYRTVCGRCDAKCQRIFTELSMRRNTSRQYSSLELDAGAGAEVDVIDEQEPCLMVLEEMKHVQEEQSLSNKHSPSSLSGYQMQLQNATPKHKRHHSRSTDSEMNSILRDVLISPEAVADVS